MNRLERMARHFDNREQLAAFLGVNRATLYRWQGGYSRIPDVGLRLIVLLEHLEQAAPHIFAGLVAQIKERSN